MQFNLISRKLYRSSYDYLTMTNVFLEIGTNRAERIHKTYTVGIQRSS